jgi:uncharacterized repeat protein (TIGR03803 family)
MKPHVGSMLSVGLLLLATSPALARKWTDSTGKHSVEAELMEVKGDKVVLKKASGLVITVPVARLSEADHRYLQSLPEPSSGPPTAVYQRVRLLHKFAGGADDGRGPMGGLTLSKSTLFGTTMGGGDNACGTVFSVNTDGTGFRLLHKFRGGANDGRMPFAGLTLSGTTLFGTTMMGGDNDRGTVFSVNTDGTGYRPLHKFKGGTNDGAHPSGGLTLSGTTLFGTTTRGGDKEKGTVFSINADGTGFKLLHKFTGEANGGASPIGLTLSGTTFFGTTAMGGNKDRGTIFSINIDGTGYRLLHEFSSRPNTKLTLSNTTLFGMTVRGDKDKGTVFSASTDGTGFRVLHKFTGEANDGASPIGLTLSGTTLLGRAGTRRDRRIT